MLANAYGSAIMMASGLAGVTSLIVAVLVEAPILGRVLNRRFRSVVKWVVLANFVSAIVGVIPVVFFRVARAPGFGADPWQVHEAYWTTHLTHAAQLLAITAVVELAVFVVLNRWRDPRHTLVRLVGGVAVANVASYTLLVGAVALFQARHSDFTLLPDTSWLENGTSRVWFVDPDTSRLCSIRLDGTDRRTEVDTQLGRLEHVWEVASVYVVVPGLDAVCFVGEDEAWWIAEDAVTKRTEYGIVENISRRGYSSAEIVESLRDVLTGMGFTVPEGGGAKSIEGVYICDAAANLFWMKSEGSEWEAVTAVYLFEGSGSGLTLRNYRSGQELTFGIPAGMASLACRDPLVLDEPGLVIFRCGGAILVMDIEARKVGRLVRGDSFLMLEPEFSRY